MLNPAAGTWLIALAVFGPALGLIMWLVVRARRPRNRIWQRRALQASQRRQLRDQIKTAVEADPALTASRPQMRCLLLALWRDLESHRLAAKVGV